MNNTYTDVDILLTRSSEALIGNFVLLYSEVRMNFAKNELEIEKVTGTHE